MDREIIDDLFCFTEILKKYLCIQIARIDTQIDDYKKKITVYKSIKLTLNHRNLAVLEYGIEQNTKRIEFLANIKTDLLDEYNRVQEICSKYYKEKEFLANCYKNKCYFKHQNILNNLGKELTL